MLMSAQHESLLTYELDPIARRITSVLATLGEYPYIRYYQPPQPTSMPSLYTSSSRLPLSGKIAQLVQTEMDNLCRADPTFPPQSQYSRAVLILVDRGVDMISPLIHDFHYQAMVNEALQVDKLM